MRTSQKSTVFRFVSSGIQSHPSALAETVNIDRVPVRIFADCLLNQTAFNLTAHRPKSRRSKKTSNTPADTQVVGCQDTPSLSTNSSDSFSNYLAAEAPSVKSTVLF